MAEPNERTLGRRKVESGGVLRRQGSKQDENAMLIKKYHHVVEGRNVLV